MIDIVINLPVKTPNLTRWEKDIQTDPAFVYFLTWHSYGRVVGNLHTFFIVVLVNFCGKRQQHYFYLTLGKLKRNHSTAFFHCY